MAGENTATFGIFWTRPEVDGAVGALKMAGYRNNDISVLCPLNVAKKDHAYEAARKMPELVTTGGATCGEAGGSLLLLGDIGSLAIPGIGPLFATGPIMAALAGAGTSKGPGAVTGALVGFGIPEYEAKCYEGRISNGGILLSVHCDHADWTNKAKQILERQGARDVSSTGVLPCHQGYAGWLVQKMRSMEKTTHPVSV